MRGWSRTVGTAAVSVALLCSCSAQKTGVSKELQEKLAQIRARAAKAVVEGTEKQRVSPEQEAAERAAQAPAITLKPGEPIWIQSGKSRILHLQRPLRRVSVTSPDLAGIVVLGPFTVMINAKPLSERKGEESRESMTGGIQATDVTSGTVLGRTLTPQPRVAETSLVIWTDEGEDVHTLIIADFIDQQVMLEVTVAEIDRSAMEEHGIDVRVVQNDFIFASFLAGSGGALTIPPTSGNPLLPLTLTPDKPTYAFIFPIEDVAALIQALQTEGLASVLAQPKLLAMSGQNAVFQVGGEIPIRIATGFSAQVVFKPFGTLVNFVPRVSDEGDIMLTVTPEVSQPDFDNRVEGIPTFLTRRASTSTRLRNGETLVIGGLLQTITREEEKGLPYFKDIPYLGYIFRRTAYSKAVTELLVVVTPHLVRPRPPGEEVSLPTDREPLKKEEVRTKPDTAETTRPRVPGLP